MDDFMQSIFIGGAIGALAGAFLGYRQMKKAQKRDAEIFITSPPKRAVAYAYTGSLNDLRNQLDNLLPPLNYKEEAFNESKNRIIYAKPVSFWAVYPFFVFLLQEKSFSVGIVNRYKESGMTTKRQLQKVTDILEPHFERAG